MELERNSHKLIKLLAADGFGHVSTKGSHHKYRKDKITVIVPHPKKDLPIGTVRAIYKQVGWIE